MTTRKYSSRAQQTTLSSGISSVDGTMTVGSGANLMGGKTPSATETYTVVIDPDTALEEIVDVSNYASGNTLTITRGRDGSTGVAHSAGAVVRHMVIGRDLQEANDHIENTTTAHGITLANLVKTTDTGTVTSTMITDGTILNADINASAAIADTKLATISTASKVSNSATTATSANTASAIVARDASGNFTAGTITGNLTGTASAATLAATATALATGRTISLTGDVTGTTGSFDGTGNATMTSAIAAGVIVNADINSSAQIAYSKTNLTNSIVDADVNASAAIAWTKIAPSSTVSSTELGYLDGVTSAVQTQLDSKLDTSTASSTYAPLASPALTGTPTAPTAAANTNTTQIATTAYVQTEINDLIASAPGALDTLNELATALGNDASFSTTVTNSLATKLPLAGGTMSGAIAMGTNKVTGLGTPTTSTDAATKGYVDGVTIAPSNLTGPITSVGAATSIASQTGTGTKFVMDTSPTLVTPVLGVASATSINGTTIPASKTLVATDSTTYVVPSQTSNSGKFLTTDGTNSSWGTIAGSLAQPSEPSSPNDGQIWIDTDGAVIGQAVVRWSKVMGAGVTSISGLDDSSVTLSYTVGYEQVYRNGVLLSRGSDYTATTGTSITLIDATILNDILEIFGSAVLAVGDVYTQAQSNSNYIGKSLTTTTGDIIYASAANTPARLGIGSTSQVLTVASGIPSWATPSSGGMTLISTTTLSGTTTTLSSIPQTYTNLQMIIQGYTGNTGNSILRVAPNGTNNATSSQLLEGYGGGSVATPYDMDVTYLYPNNNRASLRTNANNVNVVTFYNYTSSTGYKPFNSVSYVIGTDSNRYYTVGGGVFANNSAITSLDIQYGGTNTFAGGTVLLYGVK